MLSDKESMKARKSGRNRSVERAGKSWSDEQKREACQTYVVLGNMSQTANITGIPYITLRVWKMSDWWKDLEAEVRSQERIELSAKMKKIVNASLSVIEDRLMNGDYQYDQKTGKNIRKPVNMRDAHKVALDLQARQDVLDRVEAPVATEDGVEDKLLKLAEKFAEMATKSIEQKKNDVRTIDVEDVEVKE